MTYHTHKTCYATGQAHPGRNKRTEQKRRSRTVATEPNWREMYERAFIAEGNSTKKRGAVDFPFSTGRRICASVLWAKLELYAPWPIFAPGTDKPVRRLADLCACAPGENGPRRINIHRRKLPLSPIFARGTGAQISETSHRFACARCENWSRRIKVNFRTGHRQMDGGR